MKRKLIALLAVVVAFLSCAIVVVANSRGRSHAEAVEAEAKNEAAKSLADEARKAAADRIEALNHENTDLKKLLESAKADALKQTDNLTALDKETLRLRADLDAALKQVASLSQKYADALDAQRKAELAAAARKDVVVQEVKPAVVEVPAARGGKGNKNGKRRGGVASLPRTTPNFSELDTNLDGKLSLTEFKAGFPGLDDPEGTFKSLDTNGDGFLSMDEYKAGIPDPPVVHVQKKKKN